jgi:hypothetical protein
MKKGKVLYPVRFIMKPLQLQTRAVLFTTIKGSVSIQIPGIPDD